MPEERRRSVRQRVAGPVLSENSGVIRGLNLSAHGILVLLSHPMKKGQITDIQLESSGEPYTLAARSVVVWQIPSPEGYITGLEFEKIRPLFKPGPDTYPVN